MIAVEHLSKNFGGIKAVNDVSLTIEAGSITGLIGPSVHAEKKARLKDAESTSGTSNDAAVHQPDGAEDEPSTTADSPDGDTSPATTGDGQSTTG